MIFHGIQLGVSAPFQDVKPIIESNSDSKLMRPWSLAGGWRNSAPPWMVETLQCDPPSYKLV